MHREHRAFDARGELRIRHHHGDFDDAVAVPLGVAEVDVEILEAEAPLVDAVFGAIADAAARGDEVSLNAFGKFKVKASPAREGRNPATGETIKIAASKKLTFAAAKAVKDRLNG